MSSSESCDPNMFEQLCATVSTSMALLSNSLQEFFALKSELLKHSLPPKLLLKITVIAARIFRSYSDLQAPVCELTRLSRHYSSSWEEKGAGLRKLRDDYERKQRQLNIALKRIEMMAAEEERIEKERKLMNWQRLYTEVMAAKSHGRRWKFRIEPLKKKVAEGFNPYMFSSPDESEEEEDDLRKLESSEDELKNLSFGNEEGMGEELQGARSYGFSHKSVRFAGMDDLFAAAPPSPVATPPAPPTVETVDASTWTQEPEYDNYLLVQVHRPTGILPDHPLCCTLSMDDKFYCTELFPPATDKKEPPSQPQTFRFPLPDEVARCLPPDSLPPLTSRPLPRLSLAIYPRSIAEEMAGHASLHLPGLQFTEEPTVVVATPHHKETVEWEAIETSLADSIPKQYELRTKRRVGDEEEGEEEGRAEEEEEEEEAMATPMIPLVCHRVKIRRHTHLDIATTTDPLEELLAEMGYRQQPELLSRAVSAIQLEATPTPHRETTPVEEEEEEERVSMQEVMEMTQKHTEEMTQLQREYEKRLESLSHTLAKVKAEKGREVEQLEQALMEAEQRKRATIHSTAQLRSVLARKKTTTVSRGLPEWGKGLPRDFFERLELFAEESIRKHNELTERIRKEVKEACEKQLSTQHRLAPNIHQDTDTTMEDVSLPALFMPTPLAKPHIYTPRAHSYFHTPSSTDPRVTQPPSVFKMPALHKHSLSTLNLFELSQHFSRTGPQWLRQDHQSPRHTPAPPPSACGFYPTGRDTPSTPVTQR